MKMDVSQTMKKGKRATMKTKTVKKGKRTVRL